MQQKKARPACTGRAFTFSILGCAEQLGGLNIGRLLTLWTLCHFERNLLSFLEGLEASHLYRGEMSEQIFAAIVRRYKAVTLRIVEPLDGTSCHNAIPHSLEKYRNYAGDCLRFKDAYGKTGTAIKLEAKHLFAF